MTLERTTLLRPVQGPTIIRLSVQLLSSRVVGMSSLQLLDGNFQLSVCSCFRVPRQRSKDCIFTRTGFDDSEQVSQGESTL